MNVSTKKNVSILSDSFGRFGSLVSEYFRHLKRIKTYK